jgi:hypothetical protein
MHRRTFVLTPLSITAIVGLTLLSTPLTNANGQTSAPSTEAAVEPTPLLGWAFLRLGGASNAPVAVATSGAGVLVSLGGGVAASHGMFVGMARFTDSEQFFVGPGVRDKALLAGVRTAGHGLFVVGAAGVAQARAFVTSDNGSSANGPSEAALAYDFSAHADFPIAGLALAVAGVVGPQKTSYVALSLGAEVGWFGP